MQISFTALSMVLHMANLQSLTYCNLTLISECIAAEYSYNIVMFDFCEAFHKAPHQCVIDAAASFDLSSKSIKWIGSFLTGRTQQVRIGDALSINSNVIFIIIQGFV